MLKTFYSKIQMLPVKYPWTDECTTKMLGLLVGASLRASFVLAPLGSCWASNTVWRYGLWLGGMDQPKTNQMGPKYWSQGNLSTSDTPRTDQIQVSVGNFLLCIMLITPCLTYYTVIIYVRSSKLEQICGQTLRHLSIRDRLKIDHANSW